MIDAVMYGMMPRAKMVSRRKLPPENRSMKPRNDAAVLFKELLQTVRVDAGRGNVRPEAINRQQPSVNRTRLRRSGIRKMFASSNLGHFCFEGLLPLFLATHAPIHLPPALVIFSLADLENLCACTVRAVLSSPSPRILIGIFLL